MFRVTSLLVFTACAVFVSSAPQNDFGFPEEPQDGDLGNRQQGFRPQQRPQQGFRPQQGGLRPQQGGFRPQQGGLRPQQGGFRPPQNGNFPGSGVQQNNFGQNLNPNGPNFTPNNQGNSQIPGGNFQNPGGNQNSGNFQNPGGNQNSGGFQNPGGNQNSGGFQNPGGNQNSGGFQNPGGNSQLPGGNQNFGGQTLAPITTVTSTAASTGETTTRIPPRDPTNRIVYTVSCDCPYTRQYAPVCGTDGQTYGNLGVLQCTRQCGSNVQVILMGACVGNRGGG